MHKNYTFNYLSADPGAGKTEWAIKKARLSIGVGQSVLMVVPTIQLCDEIEKRSNGLIRAIHSEKGIEVVQEEIQEVFREVNKTHAAQAIVITDASFLNMRYKNGAEKWTLIKDEPREPLNITSLYMPDSAKFFFEEYADIVPVDSDERLYRAVRKPKRSYSYVHRDDTIFGKLAELEHFLDKADEFEVLFDKDKYDESGELLYSVYTKPHLFDGWEEVYFMGAYFEDTFIYNMWSNEVEWVDRTNAYLSKLPSDRTVIHYCFDYANGWSNNYREKINTGGIHKGKSNFEVYADWVRGKLGNYEFVYVVNNKYSEVNFGANAQRMPAECHGLNKFRHHTKCVLGGSYLANRGNEIFYNYYGSSTSNVRGMRNSHYYLQQLTRTAIRDRNNKEIIDVYVPTIKEALELTQYLRNAFIAHPTKDGVFGQLRSDWTERRYVEEDVTQWDHNIVTYGKNLKQYVVSHNYLATSASNMIDLITSDVENTQEIDINELTSEQKTALSELYRLISTDKSDRGGICTKIQNIIPIINRKTVQMPHPTTNIWAEDTFCYNSVLDEIENRSDVSSKYKTNLRIKAKHALVSLGLTTEMKREGIEADKVEPRLAHIVKMGEHVNTLHLDRSNKEHMVEVKRIKNTELPWITSGIFDGGARMVKENCKGATMICFDFDGTTLTDTQIKRIMKNYQYLQYTTISHDWTSKTRRIRIILPYNRVVTVSEHGRLIKHFREEFRKVEPNLKNLALDEQKMEAHAKIYVPTADAKVICAHRKNNKKTEIIDVDTILIRTPKEAVIQPPMETDIVWLYPNVEQQAEANEEYIQKKLTEIYELINSMTSGDRSYKATQVGGKLHKLPQEYHEEVFDAMRSKGVDKSGLKQARKYATK